MSEILKYLQSYFVEPEQDKGIKSLDELFFIIKREQDVKRVQQLMKNLALECKDPIKGKVSIKGRLKTRYTLDEGFDFEKSDFCNRLMELTARHGELESPTPSQSRKRRRESELTDVDEKLTVVPESMLNNAQIISSLIHGNKLHSRGNKEIESAILEHSLRRDNQGSELQVPLFGISNNNSRTPVAKEGGGDWVTQGFKFKPYRRDLTMKRD